MNPMCLDYATPTRRSPWRRVLLLTLPIAVVIGLLVYRAKPVPPAPAPPPPLAFPMYRVVGTSKDGVTISIWVEDRRGDAAAARKSGEMFIALRKAMQIPPACVISLGPKTPRWPAWVAATQPATTK